MKKTMKAAIIQKFGGVEELSLREVPIPEIDDNEVLVRIRFAGIAPWDVFEREGGYAEMLGLETVFPHILGSEGAGTVAAVGKKAGRFKTGDRVYATGFLNPKGGFYAEYAAINADFVSFIPKTHTEEQAAVFSGVGLTALRGLTDVLKLQKGESVAIVGASGGIGHIAVQIARNIGARVFAVASGEDGRMFVRQLGIEHVVNGREGDVISAARASGFESFDAALLTAGGEINGAILAHLTPRGRAAYPFGIYPEPAPRDNNAIEGYNGDPDTDILERLNAMADALTPRVDTIYPLHRIAEAHNHLQRHYCGKLALRID